MLPFRLGLCGVIVVAGCNADAKPATRVMTMPTMTADGSAMPAADGGGDAPAHIVQHPDADDFPAVVKPDPNQPLMVHVQVNGATTPCGSCSVVIAQVQGGTQPYVYRWSDPSLMGPGPHQVCPDQPTEYTVTVSDSSPVVSTPEFATGVQTAMASGKVDCRTPGAPNLDAGLADYMGCMTTMAMTDQMSMSGVPAGQATTCETGDGGYYSCGGMLAMPIRAGHTYTLSYDQLVPIVVGEPVVIDAYGSNVICGMDEKLTTWTIDGEWHHPGCFTPTRDYEFILIRVYVGFTLFYFDLLSSATFCGGCQESQP